MDTIELRYKPLRLDDDEFYEFCRENDQTKFPPVCPDFVIELLSANDDLQAIQKKIQNEWIENGCSLAWLIDPFTETAYVYRANADVEIMNGFCQSLSGENVLEGLEFDLSKLKI